MADSIIQTGVDLTARYTTNSTSGGRDIYTNPADWDKEQALYEDKTTLSFTDMLGLMVAQFQNQTMDNQASTTDMMNQLVQMSSMQAMTEMSTQIKELTLANVMSYSASLVGKTVTVGLYNEETKETEELVGVVQGTGTYNGQQVIYLDNGKGYFLSEIMAVGTLPPKTEGKPGEGEDGDGEGSGNGESEGVNGADKDEGKG